jgi:superfamily II DNA helicase RecQ
MDNVLHLMASLSGALETTIDIAAQAMGIREVVLSFVLGDDVFVLLPTGYGKSVSPCYRSFFTVFTTSLGLF